MKHPHPYPVSVLYHNPDTFFLNHGFPSSWLHVCFVVGFPSPLPLPVSTPACSGNVFSFSPELGLNSGSAGGAGVKPPFVGMIAQAKAVG